VGFFFEKKFEKTQENSLRYRRTMRVTEGKKTPADEGKKSAGRVNPEDSGGGGKRK